MIGSTLAIVQGCCALPPKEVREIVGAFVVLAFYIAFVIFIVLAVAEVLSWWRKS